MKNAVREALHLRTAGFKGQNESVLIIRDRERNVKLMKMKLDGSTLIVKDADNAQFTIIKSWGKLKWDKKAQVLAGTVSLELTDKLAELVHLPPAVERWRQRAQMVMSAVDRERMNPEPVPFFRYPVKLPLYAHQVRGANMAAVTFGWIVPQDIPAGGASNG